MEAGPHRLGQDARRIPAAIDALYQAHEAGQPVEGVTRAYVGPLKAPAVDIHTNLEEPLAEIAAVARELGYEPAPISVAVRTGDSMSCERQLMIRRPPNLLVTTPESRGAPFGAIRRYSFQAKRAFDGPARGCCSGRSSGVSA